MTNGKLSYEALKNTAGAVWLHRDVVRVQGDDAVSFLQGQISQDITNLTNLTQESSNTSATTWSWILQPHGKVDALIRLTKINDTEFIIDTDRRYGQAVIDRLNRFKLRTKVDFELLNCKVLAIRGASTHSLKLEAVDNQLAINADWSYWQGIDLISENPSIPEGLELCDREAYEALRIEYGFPEMGCELDEKTIPAEAGINDRTINFRKGCYTGQELVARIDSRGGNVPRHLRGLVIDSSEAPLPGAKVVPVGAGSSSHTKPLGVVTSAAYSPGLETQVGLAFIRREAIIPCDARVVTDEGTFQCRIVTLPINLE